MFLSNKSKQSLSTAVRPDSIPPIDPDVQKKKTKARSGSFVRSLDGCVNCRARRKKCPGSKTPNAPDDTCEACLNHHFECLGYPGQAPPWLHRDHPKCQEFKAEMQQWIRTKGKSGETLNLSKYRTSENDLEISASGLSSRRPSRTSSERVVGGASGRRKSRQSEIPSELTSTFYCRQAKAPSSTPLPENQHTSTASTSRSHQTSSRSVVSAQGTSFQRASLNDSIHPQSAFDPSYNGSYYDLSAMMLPRDTSLYVPPHFSHPSGSSRTSQSTNSQGSTPPGARPFADETPSLTAYAAANPDTLPVPFISPFSYPTPAYTPTPCDHVAGLNGYPQYFAGSTSYPAYDNLMPGTVMQSDPYAQWSPGGSF